jgi:hypothetical protein
MKYKLSICLPAIRTHLWEKFYESIDVSIGNHYSWELVMVGPNDPPSFFDDKTNFKYLKDYGSPSRCAQIAVSMADGELMMWGSDDGLFVINAIENCIKKHESLNRKDVIALKYTEGRNYGGRPMHPDYWTAHHHPVLRVTEQNYKIICVGMFKLDYFREIGGWDCRFEHLNMNTHDLAFRVQRDGGVIYESDGIVCNHDWNPGEGDHIPVNQAFDKNDLPLFRTMYSTNSERPVKIDYENWKDSPKIWQRRFGNMK